MTKLYLTIPMTLEEQAISRLASQILPVITFSSKQDREELMSEISTTIYQFSEALQAEVRAYDKKDTEENENVPGVSD